MRRECQERSPRHQLFSDPDMHHGTCVTHVPWCISGSLTGGFLWSRWRGKRSRHSRCMGNPQFYVSGKRPIESPIFSNAIIIIQLLSIIFIPSVFRHNSANGFHWRCGYSVTWPVITSITTLADQHDLNFAVCTRSLDLNDRPVIWWTQLCGPLDTVWLGGWENMAAICQWQTTCWNSSWWMRIFLFWFKFQWNLFLRIQLTIDHAALVWILAWHRTGGEPLPELIMCVCVCVYVCGCVRH